MNVAALNVVPEPMFTFPVVFIIPVAVAEIVPDVEKFPAIVVVAEGIVFVPLVLNVKLPYVSVVTV